MYFFIFYEENPQFFSEKNLNLFFIFEKTFKIFIYFCLKKSLHFFQKISEETIKKYSNKKNTKYKKLNFNVKLIIYKVILRQQLFNKIHYF